MRRRASQKVLRGRIVIANAWRARRRGAEVRTASRDGAAGWITVRAIVWTSKRSLRSSPGGRSCYFTNKD
jgi:hypothetical protein